MNYKNDQSFFLLITLLLLSGCFFPNTVTRNIRVIAQAKVDGKIVEGSAIMGLRWQAGNNGKMYLKRNADAVTLELDGHGSVHILNAFMSDDGLVNIGYWSLLVMKTFDIRGQGQIEDFDELRSITGKHEVIARDGRAKILPLMVALRDDTKLETLFEVKSSKFSEIFGSDVRFLGLWFEFTDEPITAYVTERLPIALKPNKSFYTAFPDRDEKGKLIAARNQPLPYKIGKAAFFERDY